MLQVRLHHAPAPAQVFVEPILGEFSEHAPHLLSRRRLRVEFWIARDVTDGEAAGEGVQLKLKEVPSQGTPLKQ